MTEQILWDKLVSLDNLFLAFHKAALGKRAKASVANYEFYLEENIFNLQDELISGMYSHSPYHSFTIHDPKKRLISAATFRDRVVHHALVNVIEPLFEPRFIYDSYANRVGKGTHRALDRCSRFLRRYPYYLQLDISQYFPSIDHQVMLQTLQHVIRDQKVLDLCTLVLRSGENILDSEYEMTWFPGDDLLAALRLRGLPIGNMTSQFWANVYLDPLDQYIKRTLKCKAYLRYVDDMVLFADTKQELHAHLGAIIKKLEKLRLTIHAGRAQVTPSRHGITFLGFRLFPTHRRLKREKVVMAISHIKASYNQLCHGMISAQTFDARLQGWINHACHGDTWGLRRAVLRQIGILADHYA